MNYQGVDWEEIASKHVMSYKIMIGLLRLLRKVSNEVFCALHFLSCTMPFSFYITNSCACLCSPSPLQLQYDTCQWINTITSTPV